MRFQPRPAEPGEAKQVNRGTRQGLWHPPGLERGRCKSSDPLSNRTPGLLQYFAPESPEEIWPRGLAEILVVQQYAAHVKKFPPCLCRTGIPWKIYRQDACHFPGWRRPGRCPQAAAQPDRIRGANAAGRPGSDLPAVPWHGGITGPNARGLGSEGEADRSHRSQYRRSASLAGSVGSTTPRDRTRTTSRSGRRPGGRDRGRTRSKQWFELSTGQRRPAPSEWYYPARSERSCIR